MMKTIKILLCIFCLFANSLAFGKEFSSDEQKINSAIEVLKNYGYEKNIAILQRGNYTKKPISIIFKDLSEIDFSYSKFYAITATDNSGNLFILINNDLRNSDTKALACLILHESNHCKQNVADSLNEEMIAHTQEVILYIRLLSDDENLQNNANDRLISRLNKLKKVYDEAIKTYLVSNEHYVNYIKVKE